MQVFGIRPGLANIEALQKALDHPQNGQPTVLVGGTNGKGSTAALLAAMATAAGYRTGLYTSPHLESVNERIAVDGVPISSDLLAEDLDSIFEMARAQGLHPPTHFEILTLAAWLHFRRCKVDLAILEVGLGGRLDATNACEPILSLITSIDFDHQEHLGSTLESIATEKAGILRPNRPAICGFCDPERRLLLEACSRTRGAKLFVADSRSIQTLDSSSSLPRNLQLGTDRNSYEFTFPLAGDHQLNNLCVAVLAAEALVGLGFSDLDPISIEHGVAQGRWPGRLEWVEFDSCTGPQPLVQRVLLDTAHNPAGALALAQYLDQQPLDNITLLFGALADKDIPAMLKPLSARAQRIILTRPDSPRGAMPNPSWCKESSRIVSDPGQALQEALQEEGALVVCGSIYLVGEMRRRLRDAYGAPAAPRFYRDAVR